MIGPGLEEDITWGTTGFWATLEDRGFGQQMYHKQTGKNNSCEQGLKLSFIMNPFKANISWNLLLN